MNQTLLNRYFLRQVIGSGGMADVYLAWDQLRSTCVAVKVLRRDLAQNAGLLQMFDKEAAVLRSLEHPNIVRVYEFDRDGSVAFIVMDWVDGENLAQYLQRYKGPLPLAEVLRILEPVASALNYAHQKHIFHCDVKPANIMLHTDRRVLLTDFGVARLADEDMRGGTPPYMAPEQFNGERVDARTDVYALGVTVYEMMAGGKVPFRGDSPAAMGSTLREKIAWEHTHLAMPPLRQFNPTASEALERVVETAMSKEPELRYPTTLALRDALERVRASGAADDGAGRTLLRAPSKTEYTPPAFSLNTPAQNPPASPSPRAAPQPPSPRVPAPAVIRGPHLFGRRGQLTGQALVIPAGGLTIGRSNQCQLRLSDASVSRLHAKIFFGRRGKVYLQDENSSLGTYVNGVKITGVVLLKSGDVIQVGYQQIFEYRLGM